jgi:hypothetical protein
MRMIVGIPRTRGGADGVDGAFDALLDLRESVLRVARARGGVEIFGDLRIGERTAEPGGLPEQEWHQNEQQDEREDGEEPAALHSGASGRRFCGRRRHGLLNGRGQTDGPAA